MSGKGLAIGLQLSANHTLTMMYWRIGERINRDILGNQRAEYGKQIVAQVATQLQEEYGKKALISDISSNYVFHYW